MSGMAEKLEHILFGELGRMQSNLDNDEFDFEREENKLGHVGSMLMARPVISAICAAFRGRSAKLS
jgi:hypothetical protein